MQKLCVIYHTISLSRGTSDGQNGPSTRYGPTNLVFTQRELITSNFPSRAKYSRPDLKFSRLSRTAEIRAVSSEDVVEEQEEDEDDDDTCPAECVREFKSDEEFLAVLDKAKKADSLVVVDFYRTSCGSCKYIEQIFTKMCKGAGEEDAKVVFLKHNVIDEYDEQSEVAERLRIKAVPLFHFYKNGVLLEAFPTRDKQRILAAITKYSSAAQTS